MYPALSRILDGLRREGISLRTGTSELALASFREAVGLQLPRDMAEMWLAMDGMDPGVYDIHNLRIWPLAEWQVLAPDQLTATPPIVLFADYCMNAHAYGAVVGAREASVALVGGEKHVPIAKTFADFLEKYVQDPTSIFRPA